MLQLFFLIIMNRDFLPTKASPIISKLSQFGTVTSARFNALLTLVFLQLHIPGNLGEYETDNNVFLNIKTCLSSAALKMNKGDTIQLFSQAMFLAV
jgi:hypothetical protein